MTKPSPLCCLLLALCSGSVEAQDLAKPRATPLFSNVEQGPAFMVECVNTSTEPFRTMQVTLGMAVRIDGVVHERRDRGVVGSLLGGERVLQPGDRWVMMIGLRQAALGTMSPDFGAVLRSPWLIPMAAGPHRVAFRCVGNWTDDIEIYWESASVPK